MSLDGKNEEMQRRIDALAEKQRRRIQAAYQTIADDIAGTLSRLGPYIAADPDATRSALYKFDRLAKTQAQVLAILDKQHAGEAADLNGYLASQYNLGYFFTGYTLESELGIGLAYAALDTDRIKAAALSDLSLVSLKTAQVETRQKLQRDLVLSAARGEGISQMADRMRGSLGENANNVYRIARTESTRVANEAALSSLDYAKQRGLPLLKRWISTLDGKTRDSHRHLDGATAELNERFDNGLDAPGDFGGPPGEVINCRCSLGTALRGYSGAVSFRRARGIDNKNELIKYNTYDGWLKDRVDQSAKAAADAARKAKMLAEMTAAAEAAAKAAIEADNLARAAAETRNVMTDNLVPERAIRYNGRDYVPTSGRFQFANGSNIPEESFNREALFYDTGLGPRVIIPRDLDPKKQLIGVQDAVEAVEWLPEKLRANLSNVVLVDYRNPQDLYWERTYNIPRFRSFAIGGNGTATYFENGDSLMLGGKEVRDTLAHEAGHILDEAWDPTGRVSKTKAYAAAMADDAKLHEHSASVASWFGKYTSSYAAKSQSPLEDWADLCNRYANDPLECAADFPNRVKILRKVFG